MLNLSLHLIEIPFPKPNELNVVDLTRQKISEIQITYKLPKYFQYLRFKFTLNVAGIAWDK